MLLEFFTNCNHASLQFSHVTIVLTYLINKRTCLWQRISAVKSMDVMYLYRINQGCPTGDHRVGCDPQPTFMWLSKAKTKIIFYSLYELE